MAIQLLIHDRRDMEDKKQLKVAIIGGGLVGSLCACFMAKRGHDVHLFEYRQDIRTSQLSVGRSINLALSARGRAALREVGLEEAVVGLHGIPMTGRMIHRLDGVQYPIPYDAKNKQCIYSVGRKYLNETLLSAAESQPNVHLKFNHKMVFTNLTDGRMIFQVPGNAEEVEETADLIVGADGAFSTVRRQLMKQPMFNYSQKYIKHGYLELSISATEDGQFRMAPNYLHIWPRGTFMMIALPNQDHSWTVTLFMPFQEFQTLDCPERLLQFFQKYFPDSIPLIGQEQLVKEFFATSPSPLMSVKCKPYHWGRSAIIIGDAAHAMVPFYGQGMNAGFEDCLLLDELMQLHRSDLSTVLSEFSETRAPDAAAICDLAMYNYIEMRDLVNRRSFLLRKKLDDFLFWLLPSVWVPLYLSVTFSSMRYSRCVDNKEWQDTVIRRCSLMVMMAVLVGLLACFIALRSQSTDVLH